MKQLIAILLGMLTAIVCVIRTTHVSSPNTVDWYASGKHMEIHGVITDEPDRRPLQTKYTITVDRLINESGTVLEGINGRVLVTDHRQWPPFEFGDYVIVKGTLERPKQIETFYYDRYLSRFGIYAVMYRGSIKPNPTNYNLQSTNFQRTKKNLYSLKDRFEKQINRLYPEPHASFMAGLLTGSRRGIPEHLMESFNRTGLTHIIAISGYNITIVIAIIGSLLFWLPLKVRFIPAVTAIIAFTIFVGASAAVVRAAMMGILGLLALQLGRLTNVRLSILWAAFFMIVWNPKMLWYDAGFQLSFLAVIGLTELGPLLKRWFARVPEVLAIRESLQMTVAAQIAAVPLITVLFGRFSIIAPIANLLVAPVIPLAMLLGAMGTLLSFLSFPLGQMIAYAGWGCLQWIIMIAKLCAALPLASIPLKLPGWTMLLYYGCLIAWLIKYQSISGEASQASFTTHREEYSSSRKSTAPVRA